MSGSQRPAHRPTKLTAELRDMMVKILRRGAFVDAACLEVGISDSAFYEWCRRGEEGEEPFRDFLDSIRTAQARAHNAVVAVAQRGAVRDPALAMSWLQLRYARRYSATHDETPTSVVHDFDEQRRRTLELIRDPDGRRRISETLDSIWRANQASRGGGSREG